jgi:hypothetical protein
VIKRFTTVFALLGSVLFLAGCVGVTSEAATPGEQIISPSGAFTFVLPPGVADAAGEDARCGDAVYCWASDTFVVILEEVDVGDAADVVNYVELTLPDLIANNPGAELLSQTAAATDSGLPVARAEVSLQDGLVRAYEQYTITDGEILRLTFTGLADDFESIRPVAEALFASVAALGE